MWISSSNRESRFRCGIAIKLKSLTQYDICLDRNSAQIDHKGNVVCDCLQSRRRRSLLYVFANEYAEETALHERSTRARSVFRSPKETTSGYRGYLANYSMCKERRERPRSRRFYEP